MVSLQWLSGILFLLVIGSVNRVFPWMCLNLGGLLVIYRKKCCVG